MTTFQRLMITKGVIKQSQIASLLGETSSEGETSESGGSQESSDLQLQHQQSQDMFAPSPLPPDHHDDGISEPVVDGSMVSTSMGYMRFSGQDESNAVGNEEEEREDTVEENLSEKEKPKKLKPKEYRNRKVQSKCENRTSKSNINSFKNKYLNVKKKNASIQVECGQNEDFIIAVRNNLQSKSVVNPSPTAEKYIVYARGQAKIDFLGDGFKYNPSEMFLCKNESNNFDEEKVR